MKEVKDFYRDNQEMWDAFAEANFSSETYKTKAFLEGESTLSTIELNELGKLVNGKKLLHLQCHFGLDSLSWVREGAIVTGVDISNKAIELARMIAEKSKLNAKFIQSNIYDLPKNLDDKFDIVFTSYGVLCWLDNLEKWAEIIAHFLKPGGIFYIAEFHRFIWVFDWDAEDDYKLKYNYFHEEKPLSYTTTSSYAAVNKDKKEVRGHEWQHTMSDVINNLIKAGLQIKFLNEYPIAIFQRFNFLIETKDGFYKYENEEIQLPLTFTIMAIKK